MSNVQGFLPAVKSSRPAESIASTKLPMEDSESLIRLYKRKKAECENLREKALSLETELQ